MWVGARSEQLEPLIPLGKRAVMRRGYPTLVPNH